MNQLAISVKLNQNEKYQMKQGVKDFKNQLLELKIGGSSDFEMRRAIVYRENYFQMMEATYSGLNNYEKVIEELKKISNPLDFYSKLSKIESGEKLKDISFMYNNQPFQANLNRLAIELGIKDVEDTEEVEEGE